METKETRRPTTKKTTSTARRSGGTTRKVSSADDVSQGSNRSRGTTKTKRNSTKVSPEVVYTQPVPFNRGRFVLSIAIVVAVVLAILFGMSIFFKVDESKITVTGMDKYSAWTIREASGIKNGENLLSINEERISNNIIAKLPYVQKVRVGIKLPDTVKIEIVEMNVDYAAEAGDGSWWLMRSDGVIIDKTNSADAELRTKIIGVKLDAPQKGEKAIALQPEQPTDEETQPVTVLANEQLELATSIAQYLEDNGIIGGIASIDVSNTGNLQMWYGTRFQVFLGDKLNLGQKIATLKASIDSMGQYRKGTLDVSYAVMPDQVIYTPFPES